MKPIFITAILICLFCSARAQHLIKAFTNDPVSKSIKFVLKAGNTTFRSGDDGVLKIDTNSDKYKKWADSVVDFSFHYTADENIYKIPEIFKSRHPTLSQVCRLDKFIIRRRSLQ